MCIRDSVTALAVGDHHEPGLAAGGDDVAERRDAGCAETFEAGELRLDGDTCRPGRGFAHAGTAEESSTCSISSIGIWRKREPSARKVSTSPVQRKR